MSCADIQDLLASRLDEPLSASDQALVAAHVAQCADCALVERRLETLLDDLALLADVSTPGDLAATVAARVPAPRRGNLSRGGPAGQGPVRRRSAHDLRRVAGWAAVMLTASLALLGRDVAGSLADNAAPLLARARQEAARSQASGTSLLARLDDRAASEFERIKTSLAGPAAPASRSDR